MGLFKKAERHQAFLRAQLIGVSGSGKTFTALQIARGLAATDLRVAVVDSERGTSALYADQFDFDFVNVVEVPCKPQGRQPGKFDPERYITAINAAETEGFGVLVIDSLTHAWSGEGGVQEIVDGAKAKFGGNAFAAWSIGGPLWNKLLDTIVNARLHVIATARAKAEYVETEGRGGKKTYEKVGTRADQRAEAEFEFDFVAKMDLDHNLVVEKTRYPDLGGAVVHCPSPALGRQLREWLAGGKPVAYYDAEEFERRLIAAAGPAATLPAVAAYCESLGRQTPARMSADTREQLVAYLASEKGQRAFASFAAARPAADFDTGDESRAQASPANGSGAKQTTAPTANPAPAADPISPTAGAGAAPNGEGGTVERLRAARAVIDAGRQELGEGVFAELCARLGIEPGRYHAAGLGKVAELAEKVAEARQGVRGAA